MKRRRATKNTVWANPHHEAEQEQVEETEQ